MLPTDRLRLDNQRPADAKFSDAGLFGSPQAIKCVSVAGLISNALADEGIGFQVPWAQLVVFTIIAVIAGVLAAIVPARRAAKLNVLRALQYE